MAGINFPRISSLISATPGLAPGNAFAIARSPFTTWSIICVPCCIAGDGVGEAGDAACGEVGGPCWAEASSAPGGGGIAAGVEAI